MPANKGTVVRIDKLDKSVRLAEPERGQEQWYHLAAELIRVLCGGQHLNVVDVGAGSGYGLSILRSTAHGYVLGIDPLVVADGVASIPIDMLRSKSFDVVTCMDVIEHVENDVELMFEMHKVARKLIVLSTPNWNSSKCENKYHYREYTPAELQKIVGPHEYLVWTCRRNRVDGPPIWTPSVDTAEDIFCIAIRAEHCTDEEWGSLHASKVEAAHVAADSISTEAYTAEEWLSSFQRRIAGQPPIEACYTILCWLKSNIKHYDPAEEPQGHIDAIKVIRSGLATPLEQAVAISSLLNHLVLAPTGPYYVNQAKR
jgi:SAM-dependent methyltransferase